MIFQDSWVIAKKEISLLFKSTRRIFLLLTTPLILFLIFGLMMISVVPMLSTVDKPIEITVIQDDNGVNGTNWGEQFYALLRMHNLTKNYVYSNSSVDELDNLLETNNFSILLYIPANFSQIINSSLPAQFYLHFDNSDLKNEMAVGNIQGISQSLNQRIIFHYHGIINLTNIFFIPEPTSSETGLEGFVASYITLIPLYAIIFLVIPSLSLVLISVTIEREQKTLESLILQPIQRKSIITGKLLYGSLIIIFNTIVTLASIMVILALAYVLLPGSIKNEIMPLITTLMQNMDITVLIFILYLIIGLILSSLLTITAAVFFSLMAKDEREANMVISALVIIPMVSTILIAFLPIGLIDSGIEVILVALPLLGYLFSVYISITTSGIPLTAWLGLFAQLAWILIGVWTAGRLIESEGILEISYKRLIRFRRR